MTKHPTLWARAAEDRRWTTVVLAVLCIALVAWTFRVAVGGSLFRLQKIEVVGVGEPHAERAGLRSGTKRSVSMANPRTGA